MAGRGGSRRFTPIILLILVIAAFAISHLPERKPEVVAPGAESSSPTWSVYFSPEGGATQAVVNALAGARQTVLVQAYSFTSAPIARALVAAHQRGVKVQVLLDKSNLSEKYSSADFLQYAGLATFIDSAHAIAHNKVIIIDGETVITGSFNFTKSAEQRNAENLLIIRDPTLAAQYTHNWEEHRAHSREYLKGER